MSIIVRSKSAAALSIRIYTVCIYTVCICWFVFLKRTLESRNRLNGSKINHNMKTLIVTFMLLFNHNVICSYVYILSKFMTYSTIISMKQYNIVETKQSIDISCAYMQLH